MGMHEGPPSRLLYIYSCSDSTASIGADSIRRGSTGSAARPLWTHEPFMIDPFPRSLLDRVPIPLPVPLHHMIVYHSFQGLLVYGVAPGGYARTEYHVSQYGAVPIDPVGVDPQPDSPVDVVLLTPR